MVPVLVDDWLYMDVDGQPGTYGREEMDRSIKSRVKRVVAAFIDCEVKLLALPTESQAQKEALINGAFANDFLIQQERLGGDVWQVVGAKVDKIDGIYQYFKPVIIETLVPYPIALRAFLKSQGLLTAGKIVVFIDDLKTQAIVTLFEGQRVTAPRRISMRDLGYMTTEIRRSQQNFLGQRELWPGGKDIPCVFISNNREWLAYFMEHGLVSQEDMTHVPALFPVLEGLRTAKFGLHFLPLTQLVNQKQRAIIKNRLKNSLGVALAGLIGTAIFATAYIFRNDTQMSLRVLQAEQERARLGLANIHQVKFKSMLGGHLQIDYSHLYFDFVLNVPADYVIKQFSIHASAPDKWLLTGLIFPYADNTPHAWFFRKGMFTEAKVSAVAINKRLGQKIDLTIDQGDTSL